MDVVSIAADGWTQIEPSLAPERTMTAYAFHREWWRTARFFQRDGLRYQVASAVPTRPLPALSKLLASTVYNPTLTVRYEYRAIGRYELSELQRAVIDAIDKDDDILTQFHEAEELTRRVHAARTFDEIR